MSVSYRSSAGRIASVVALAVIGVLLPTGAAHAASDDLTVEGQPVRATQVTARFPAGVVKARTARSVTGMVSGTPGRTVALQDLTARGWRTVATTRARANGAYALKAPTNWLGRHTLRVLAPRTNADTERISTNQGTLTTKPAYIPRPGGTSYDISYRTRWNPCRAITYRVNRYRLPAAGLRDVKEAFRRVSEATGLRFRYLGSTTHVPLLNNRTTYVSNADISVAWATPAAVPSLRGSHVGQGVTRYVSGAGGWNEIIKGGVVLDATYKVAAGFATTDNRNSRGAMLLHELGHVVGLGHVNDGRQLMNAVIPSSAARYAAGDLTGLGRVGAKQGCF